MNRNRKTTEETKKDKKSNIADTNNTKKDKYKNASNSNNMKEKEISEINEGIKNINTQSPIPNPQSPCIPIQKLMHFYH